MDTNFEQKVRERAYHLWLNGGMSTGAELDHWLQAEQAVSAELGAKCSIATAPAARKTVAKSAIKTKKPSRRSTATH